MSSPALQKWRSDGLERLRELEEVHSQAAGSGPGRRWGTTQLNRALFVALVSEFQRFARDLHDEAIEVHAGASAPGQRTLLRTLLAQGRKLDTHNPRKSALGSDFGRLGIDFIDLLRTSSAASAERLRRLDVLVDFRNAVGHGNDSEVAALVRTGEIAETKQSYVRYRRTLNALAGTMDRVVAVELAALLGTPEPW